MRKKKSKHLLLLFLKCSPGQFQQKYCYDSFCILILSRVTCGSNPTSIERNLKKSIWTNAAMLFIRVNKKKNSPTLKMWWQEDYLTRRRCPLSVERVKVRDPHNTVQTRYPSLFANCKINRFPLPQSCVDCLSAYVYGNGNLFITQRVAGWEEIKL